MQLEDYFNFLSPNDTRLKVIVIGGGAAGFFGAIACATEHSHSSVILLEAGSKPLAKVLISGGGRCNVTHHCFEPARLVQYYPRGGKALRGTFSRFQPRDTVNWFASHGVKLKTEPDGRMFPVTDNSETIAHCLRETARDLGVRVLTRTPVQKVRRSLPEGFELDLRNGRQLQGDRLLIATGSNPLGYRFAQDLGHSIIAPVPSLFTFNISDPRLEDLAGVSVPNVSVRLLNTGKEKFEQSGALLITHWGVSGPAILKLSAWAARILHEHHYQMSLMINWMPEYNAETLRQYLWQFKKNNPKKRIYSFSPIDSLPKRIWQNLVRTTGIKPDIAWAELSKKNLDYLVQELNQGIYKIQGKGIFKEEFVTCGGVNLKEIDFKTMQSKICPGLYFAGEILDIDGVTGGFNFQSAWTTSYLAGKAMGEISSLKRDK